MNISFLHRDIKDQKDQSGDRLPVSMHESRYNANEGCEFLDDALRMEGLSRIHTEESIAPGSPKGLL